MKKQKLFELLAAFRNSAADLSAFWINELPQGDELQTAYPFPLSFDDLVNDIDKWIAANKGIEINDNELDG